MESSTQTTTSSEHTRTPAFLGMLHCIREYFNTIFDCCVLALQTPTHLPPHELLCCHHNHGSPLRVIVSCNSVRHPLVTIYFVCFLASELDVSVQTHRARQYKHLKWAIWLFLVSHTHATCTLHAPLQTHDFITISCDYIADSDTLAAARAAVLPPQLRHPIARDRFLQFGKTPSCHNFFCLLPSFACDASVQTHRARQYVHQTILCPWMIWLACVSA